MRRLLEERLIVNVAFTTDENEVKPNELKTALEAAEIDDIVLDKEPVEVRKRAFCSRKIRWGMMSVITETMTHLSSL